jgi:hypothetical protein
MDERLDGNAAGGLLGELFAGDLTGARATCAGCGATDPLGAFAAYIHGMGVIVRCPACDTVLVRVAHTSHGYWLDMRGVRVLHLREGG